MTQAQDTEKLNAGAPEQLEMRAQRRAKLLKRAALILCILAGVGMGLLLRRCKPAERGPVAFDADGLILTLDARFQETGDRSGFDRAYKSNQMSVFVRRHAPETAERLDEYAARSAAELGADGAELRRENGLTWIEYDAPDGSGQRCLAAFYPGADGWRTVVFCCKSGKYEACRPEFLQFAAAALPPQAAP